MKAAGQAYRVFAELVQVTFTETIVVINLFSCLICILWKSFQSVDTSKRMLKAQYFTVLTCRPQEHTELICNHNIFHFTSAMLA